MRYRQYVDPNKMPLFRGGERIRMMTMIVMLGVIGMLVFRARDPRMWRHFAAQEETVSPKTLREFDKAQKQRLAAAAARNRPAGDSLALAGSEPPAGPAGQPNASPPPAGDSAPPAAAPPKEAAGTPEKPQPAAAAAPAAKPELADDVPPPEPTVDPEYLQKIAEPAPRATPSPGEENASTPSPGSSSAPMVAGPAGEESANKPRETGSMEPGGLAGGKAEPLPEVPAVDEDPIERKDFEYECQALDDKHDLRPEEMAAYWRLVRWAEDQKFDDLERRARADITFGQLFEHPASYRGQLVKLKVQVRRATAEPVEENGKSIGRIYNLWGTTDESGYNPYSLIVVHLPDDFPLGGRGIQEEVTFVGFFLKLMRYTAPDDKTRAAPLLIGKVRWHPSVAPVFPLYLKIGIGCLAALLGAAMLLAHFTFRMYPRRRIGMLPPLHEGEEGIPIETWLERVEQDETHGEPPDAINPHATGEHPTNGNGNGHVLPRRLDHSEDQER